MITRKTMLFSTPGLGAFISGVILFEEIYQQNRVPGAPLPGFPGEKLMREGHSCVVCDRYAKAAKALHSEGAVGTVSLADAELAGSPGRVPDSGEGR